MAIQKTPRNAIKDNAITSAKIEDGAITAVKIDPSANITKTKAAFTATQPSYSSLTPSIADPNNATAITITGANFISMPSVDFISSTGALVKASVVSFTSSTEIVATFPTGQTAGTYKVRIENPKGVACLSTDTITYSIAPAWSTSAGSLATVTEGDSVSVSVLALDDDSTAVSSYAITSGALPSGVTLNTTTGLISGTAPQINANTTYNFSITATDDESQQTSRDFSITVQDFAVTHSCRFEKADNPELSRATSDGNEKVGSFSFWWKSGYFSGGCIFYSVYTDSNNFFDISVDGSGNFQVRNKASGSYNMELKTNRVLRDPTGWYSIIVLVDTTQATEADRVKIYINGTLETSFATGTYPSQNTDLIMNSNSQTARISSSQDRMHGYLSEYVLIDGTAKVVGDFGEFDSDSPTIWKPKSVSGLSGDKGANGFYLDFKDSANLGNCAFAGTDFTESNLAASDQVTDTPVNNFCVLNPLDSNGVILYEGNLKTDGSDSGGWGQYNRGTLSTGLNGKFYWELSQWDDTNNEYSGNNGITSSMRVYGYSTDYVKGTNNAGTYDGKGWYLNTGDGNPLNATSVDNDTNGDITMIAYDASSGKLWFGVNGTWEQGPVGSGSAGTGNPGAGTYQTANVDLGGTNLPQNTDTTGDEGYTRDQMPVCERYHSGYIYNFGQDGTFAGTKTAQNNADANGYGNFYYAVPTGFYALCTKNLYQYG